MLKRTILAVLVVFVVWSVLDFVIHGLILQASYTATSHLWRPMPEMKTNLLHVVVFIAALAFVLIYSWLVADISIASGLKYGLLFGLASGVSMGYGSYAVMPITYHIALVWFLGKLVEAVLGGITVARIIRS